MTPLRAFHENPAIKATYLARVRAHREADELIRGTYWEDGKGCAVGCTIHGSDHSAYERELGIPATLAYLEDQLFESLPTEAAQQWPEHFLEAIPVGADLSLVWPQFAIWLLTDPQAGVIRFSRDDQARHAITGVAGLYQRVCTRQAVSREEWTAAAWAARDAADASWAAGVSRAAARAAWAAWAAGAAALAARDAADASWAAGAAGVSRAAARAAARKRQAEKLLELRRFHHHMCTAGGRDRNAHGKGLRSRAAVPDHVAEFDPPLRTWP